MTLWKTLVHEGVRLPEPYQPLPRNVKLIYDGKPITLTPEEEMPAVFFAKYIGTPYTENPRFIRNFFADWKKFLGKKHTIQEWDLLDFNRIKEHLVSKSVKKQAKTNDDKYKYCMIDGKKEPVTGYVVEPPGLFLGRGKHPLTGRIKKQIRPEDVTLNLSKDAKIPTPNVPGEWGAIVHDRDAMWIASWVEEVSGKRKYAMLARDSSIRGDNDREKFERARTLAGRIGKIRARYTTDLDSRNPVTKQIATAVYLIDTLALRVGNAKGEHKADTVGVSTLRTDHVRITEDCVLTLDFLGKDSIRYLKKFLVTPPICRNIKEFLGVGTGRLFPDIASSDINGYLQALMPDLTAKVFRTMNASVLFQERLYRHRAKLEGLAAAAKGEGKREAREAIQKIMCIYQTANVEVANLCNHRKASKTGTKTVEALEARIRAEKDAGKKRMLKEKLSVKKSLMDVSVGTSKDNYIDPRITVALFKHLGLPLEKVFSPTQIGRVSWAIEEIKDGDGDWKF
jgi:DNA topoisomerase-1